MQKYNFEKWSALISALYENGAVQKILERSSVGDAKALGSALAGFATILNTGRKDAV